ncbi:hypothetical protein Taro_046911, partial [Colocasia esculenta]|nr:hypothetical protein [Colocasia esculenta]
LPRILPGELLTPAFAQLLRRKPSSTRFNSTCLLSSFVRSCSHTLDPPCPSPSRAPAALNPAQIATHTPDLPHTSSAQQPSATHRQLLCTLQQHTPLLLRMATRAPLAPGASSPPSPSSAPCFTPPKPQHPAATASRSEHLHTQQLTPSSRTTSRTPEMGRKKGFTHFCLGRVDTRSKQVDTSPRFQKTQLPDWDIRSTLDQVRSTLVPGKRAHTLPEEAFWRPKGVLQICLHLQKLQAILSRGRTRESRGIPGEKVVVQGKGADPTEEAQEKKDFWHFRCHQSRASPIEENLHRFPSSLFN